MKLIRSVAFTFLLAVIGCNDPGEISQPSALLVAYPNPMSRGLFVTANNTSTSEAQLIVFDPNGEIVGENSVGSGVNQFQFDVLNRPIGRFHVIFKVGGQVHSVEVLKK